METDNLVTFRTVGAAVAKEVLAKKGFPASTENIRKLKEANKDKRIFPSIDSKGLVGLLEDLHQGNYKWEHDLHLRSLFAKKKELEAVAIEQLIIPPDLEKEEELS